MLIADYSIGGSLLKCHERQSHDACLEQSVTLVTCRSPPFPFYVFSFCLCVFPTSNCARSRVYEPQLIPPPTPNVGYGHESTETKQLSLCHNTTLADLPQDNTTGTQRPQRTPGASPIRYLLTTNNKPPAAHISLHTHYKLLKECQHSNCLSWSKTGRVPNKKSCPKTHTYVTI